MNILQFISKRANFEVGYFNNKDKQFAFKTDK